MNILHMWFLIATSSIDNLNETKGDKKIRSKKKKYKDDPSFSRCSLDLILFPLI